MTGKIIGMFLAIVGAVVLGGIVVPIIVNIICDKTGWFK